MLILTQDEAEQIKSKLEDFRLALYKTNFKAEKYIDENFTESEKAFVSGGLKSVSDPDEIEKSIDKLLKDIANMESVLIKVAFEPPVSFTIWLKEFFEQKTNGAENLVIKIESDKSVLAGVVMEFKGKIRDQSAKADILNILSGAIAAK
jgi:hypothetical protein